MGNLLSRVDISGTTIKDDSSGSDPNLLVDWEYERTIERGISEIDLRVIQATNDTVTLIVGQTLSIWIGFSTSTDTKVFEGFISDFRPEGGLIKITGKDKMWDLVRKTVNNVYLDTGAQSGQVSAIAKDLIETYGGLTSDEQATGTNVGETIAEFRCDQTTIYERLMTLAKAVQYQVLYDAANDTVHFEPRGFTASNTTLTVGTEIIGVPNWENDTSMMVNDLRVDGAVHETEGRLPVGTGNGIIDTTTNFDTDGITILDTPESVQLILENANPPTEVKIGGTKDGSSGHFYYVDKENKKIVPATGTTFTAGHRAIVNYTWLAPAPVHQIRQSSIDDHGLFEKEITLSDIQTIIDAEARTAQILDRFSEPFLVGDLLVKSASTISLNVGDKVIIVDALNKPNINQNFVITKQIIKYPGSSQELTVGDESIRLSDWHFNVEARLKRLEEKFLKNQDIIQELFDFRNTLTIQPRYRKIFTETYDTGNNVMIWNNPDHGIWNTDNWGTAATAFEAEADHFIQQFEDSYTEDFIDDDFEDTNGTASWSTTGSVEFTSGQIALSKSIDYNNSTITVATLDSTEVSGDFDYELAADGSTFESVTPGTAHTFSATGNDLRFKVTENAASTGEISQITIQDYH